MDKLCMLRKGQPLWIHWNCAVPRASNWRACAVGCGYSSPKYLKYLLSSSWHLQNGSLVHVADLQSDGSLLEQSGYFVCVRETESRAFTSSRWRRFSNTVFQFVILFWCCIFITKNAYHLYTFILIKISHKKVVQMMRLQQNTKHRREEIVKLFIN